MTSKVDGYFIKCAASLAATLTEEISVPSEMLAGPERDAGYAAVSAHEEEVVVGLAAWLGELPAPDFRTAPPPAGADLLISLNLGELLADYGTSCVYLVAEAVLRLYRPYLLAALAVSRKVGERD